MGRQMTLFPGAKIGRWTLIRLVRRVCNKTTLWECLCDCGTTKNVHSPALYAKTSQSCGCLHHELMTKHGGYTEGQRRMYTRWKMMLARCENPKNKSYHNYGGRGIAVCGAWKDFDTFLKDMGEAPPKMTLDRVDNSGPYSKENCRWTTQLEQAHNARTNHWWELGERLVLLSQIAKEVGMNLQSLRSRVYQQGMTLEEALSKPLKPAPKKRGEKK